MTKLMTLRQWADSTLGNMAPKSDVTLRRWAAGGNIIPRPRKIGKQYAVKPDARYINHNDEASLAEMI